MSKILNWIFPLSILAFAGPSILFVSTIFSTRQRWVFLLLLALSQLFVTLRLGNNLVFYVMLSFYAFWNICTTYWSESYQLTLAKSLLFAAVSLTFLVAGQVWTRERNFRECFDGFIPLTVVMIVSSAFAYLFYPFAFDSANFRGLVGNANMFGSFMAMTLPLLFFKLYINWSAPRNRWIWLAGVLLVLLLLVMSRSRAAMLCAFCCMGSGMILLPKRVIALIFGVFLSLVTVATVINPEFATMVKNKYIMKQRSDVLNPEESLLFSREKTWEESLEKALEGGIVGAGFGVSIGEGTWGADSFTTFGYGREKGNSQLAVMEETGIVGLCLYTVMLLYLFAILISRILSARDKQLKMALSLAAGTLFGFLLQSTLEATWTAPGAPESVYFWALTGCALGLSASGRNNRRTPACSSGAMESTTKRG